MGSAPTDLQARTGLLTPPGIISKHAHTSDWEFVKFIIVQLLSFAKQVDI